VPCHRQLDMTFNRKRQLIANLGLSFKLEESDIISIFQEAKTGKNYKDIARTYHVDESNIRLILNRKTWKHVEVQL
jgi:Mor family transcriptional regulator